MRTDPFFVCKQELGARQQTPGCPGRAFCSSAQGRSRSLSLITPGTHTPGRRPSASCVVGFEVQPAEPPGPLLPSQIFHIWWLQLDERTDHPLSILLGLPAFMVGTYATFTGGPLARTSHMLKCLSHPKKVNTVTINTCKTSPSILANIIILPYIYIFPFIFISWRLITLLFLDLKIMINVTDMSGFSPTTSFFVFFLPLNSSYYSHEYFQIISYTHSYSIGMTDFRICNK